MITEPFVYVLFLGLGYPKAGIKRWRLDSALWDPCRRRATRDPSAAGAPSLFVSHLDARACTARSEFPMFSHAKDCVYCCLDVIEERENVPCAFWLVACTRGRPRQSITSRIISRVVVFAASCHTHRTLHSSSSCV